ncbi:MAG: tetratricopeptide repeat protein [Saprospiraceae bacterium]
MSKWVFIFFLLTFSSTVFSQNKRYETASGAVHIWGEMQKGALLKAPYSEWYEASIKGYKPNSSLIKNKRALSKMDVTIYLGTWCGDSKNYVPKFFSLWQSLNLSEKNIKIIGLHGSRDHYKQGPNGEEKGAHIHRVPTFIFSKDGEEVGRIVERPINSLEMDVAQIAAGIPSLPRYQAVSYMIDFYDNYEIEQFDSEYDNIIHDIGRLNNGVSELNTYGIVLQLSGRLQRAQQIFKINNELYPFEPKSYYSLGVSHMKMEEWEDAQKCFIEVLKIDPEHKRVVKKLYDTNEKIK